MLGCVRCQVNEQARFEGTRFSRAANEMGGHEVSLVPPSHGNFNRFGGWPSPG